MNLNSKSFVALAASAFLFFSCENKSQDKKTAQAEHHGIDLHFMDTTVSPKQDFYHFVNGTWMEEAEIPHDRSSWGSFMELRKKTDDNVLQMLNEAIENNHFDAGSDQIKAVYLFKSQMDTTARNKAGLDPILPTLEKINEIKDLESLQQILSDNFGEISNPFYGFYASAKLKESSMNGANLSGGSLGLPDRDYYTSDSEESQEIRDQYKDYIIQMFGFLGEDQETAQDKADKILALETKIAESLLTKEERRNANNLNNPRTFEELSQLNPVIDWRRVFNQLPVEKQVDTINIPQIKYAERLKDILTETDIEDIKTLLTWHNFNNSANLLTTELERARWEFYQKTLNGVPEQMPLEERALARVNQTLGEALGKIYVGKYFPPEAKETAETMVENVMEVFKQRVQNLDWMSEQTKERAIRKVDAMTVKIGYPDEWKDYSEVEINENNSFYANVKATSKWRTLDNLSRINEPVDLTEWFMSPQTVNAYFSPSRNEIVFPAGILQPPFFDYEADAAVNFGGIGAVIGHEISHAFDDSGARFDAEGNLNDWWQEEDKKQFEAKTKQLIEFYDKVEVEDGLFLNGTFTAGENAADLGGVTAAYHGLQRFYETHEKPGKIDGFTQEQRFFMSWATVWRNKTRAEALRTQIKNDPHSPAIYRAYLPLQNVDEFYEAFDIQEGDEMYIAPEERVKIW